MSSTTTRKTTDDLVSEDNEIVQTQISRKCAFTYLAELPLARLRGVADLNYCDPYGTRDDMIMAILDDRFGY